MKAVGAVAAGRNRIVHMKTVGVTIYRDEGSKGSNPALSAETKTKDFTKAFKKSFKASYIS